MSSSQLAQVERGAGEGGAADRDEAAELRLLRGVPAAGARRDRPGRRGDDEHEYGDDQAVGQQGADDARRSPEPPTAPKSGPTSGNADGRAHGLQVPSRSHWPRSRSAVHVGSGTWTHVRLLRVYPRTVDPATCSCTAQCSTARTAPSTSWLTTRRSGSAGTRDAATRTISTGSHLLSRPGSP